MNDPRSLADHVVHHDTSRTTDAPSPERLEGTIAYTQEELPAVTELGSMGRYRLVKTVGAGGFGVVYQAHDEELKRDVAIKLLKHTVGKQAELLLAEARTLAQLDHPAIVPVYDVGRATDGAVFVVSKFLEGDTLANWLQTHRLSAREAARWTAVIAEALDYTHRQGLIHRDVKPANILLTSAGDPVLADFGLAMPESAFGIGARFVGTRSYMSPEQARHEGHRVDGRTDIYSLGTVLYEMLVGTRPFHAETEDELLDLIRNVEPRPPRQLDRNVPRELERICLKALSKRAADRYSTAQDFAADLRLWLDGQRETVVEPSAIAAPTSHVESGSSHSQTPVVVPRGLRAFDEADADFFVSLLPGARDRDGLPESVRFWKTRIEATDDSRSFRVGVLLGPSGSGKSSLVRAGLTPTLAANIQVLTIEATAAGLEEQLLKRLRRDVEGLQIIRSLRDATRLIRQQTAKLRGRKLLIVIDQFEQWLNAHAGQERTDLVEALRQCDGVTLQAMLLVRDDFTLAVSRFMDELEEPLQQNRNFAAVDLFSPDHAARVLEAFGRAYRVWTLEPSRDQQRFMEQATQQLAANGRLVPVQLAVFADMVKDRPWSVATLQQLGGMEGIGVAFLDERLAGPKSHPEVQAHLPAIRQLLRRLLPGDAENIKGRGRTRSELAADLAGLLTAEQLDRLLVLLDVEVRLLTPAGSATAESSDSSSVGREPTYQLAHDYLVPPLRAWLSANERSTHAGRARLRLRELADAWHRRPDSRHLPSWFEWATIRLLIRSGEWTDPQRNMMRIAGRRIAQALGICIIVIAAAGYFSREALGRWQARMLTERLLNADTIELPDILAQLRDTDRWSHPILIELANVPSQAPAGSIPDERERRRQLHLSLALADRVPKHLDKVLAQLTDVPVEHLATVRGELCRARTNLSQTNSVGNLAISAAQGIAPHGDRVASSLWPVLETSLPSGGKEALPVGAMLAELSPADGRWTPLLAALAQRLMSARASQVKEWGELYRPLAPRIVPRLLDLFRQSAITDVQARGNLVELITMFGRSDTTTLVEAIVAARPHELPDLLEPTQHNALALRNELQRRLRALHLDGTRADPIPPANLPKDVEQQIRAASGAADGQFIWAPRLRADQFADLHATLTKHGYSPSCLRPFVEGGTRRVAAIFRHDSRGAEIRWHLPLDEARATLEQFNGAGWELVDFCADVMPTTSTPPTWSLAWKKVDATSSESRAYLDCDWTAHEKLAAELPRQGFVLKRHDQWLDSKDHLRVAAIWSKSTSASSATTNTQSYSNWNYAAHASHCRPGNVQEDLRATYIDLVAGDPLCLIEEATRQLDRAKARQVANAEVGNAANQIAFDAAYRASNAFSAVGRFEAAERVLNELPERLRTSLHFRAHHATLSARMGRLTELRSDVEALPELIQDARRVRFEAGAFALLKLRLALLEPNQAALDAAVKELGDANSEGTAAEPYLRGLGLLASHPAADADERTQLIAALDRPPVEVNLLEPHLLYFSQDFGGVRLRPEFQAFLRRTGYDRRFRATFTESTAIESRQLLALHPTEHERHAQELRAMGFWPVTLDLLPAIAGGESSCSSVWQRALPTPQESIRRARRGANLVLALAKLKEWEPTWESLRNMLSRDVRARVQVHLCQMVEPAPLVNRLLDDSGSTATNQAALVQALGGYSVERLPKESLESLQFRLTAWANTAEDPLLRSSAEWCLRRWKMPEPATANATMAKLSAQRWHRNKLGQILVRMQPTQPFIVGSPRWEPAHSSEERQNWTVVQRTFAIATTEVSQAQFETFLKATRGDGIASFDGDPRTPRTTVDLIDARRFCHWLSKHEGIPESEWCYPDIEKARPDEFPFPKNQLQRTGYRLPTECEWEFAVRAGASGAYFFGDDEELLESFAWYSRNAQGTVRPGGTLRPNDFGLFDMLGNVHEWMNHVGRGREIPSQSSLSTDLLPEGLWKVKADSRSVRGGSASSPSAALLRIADRPVPGTTPTKSYGFRIARTLPND